MRFLIKASTYPLYCYNSTNWARFSDQKQDLVGLLPSYLFFDGLRFDEVFMIDVFFNGSGFWFYRHKRSQRTYKISCVSNTPVLMPLPDEEMHCFDPVKSIGYFSLIRDDEITYKSPESLLTVNALVPLPDQLIEHNGRSTFINLTENLSLGFAGINANDCRFIIDTMQPYSIKFDNRDNHITNDHLFVDKPIEDNKTVKPEVSDIIDITIKTQTKINEATKPKVRKDNLAPKDLLTDLIHHFLDTIGTKIGDARPFGSKRAWGKITNEYKNEGGIIVSIKKNNTKTYTYLILNSADDKKVEYLEFQKRYNAQFIKET